MNCKILLILFFITTVVWNSTESTFAEQDIKESVGESSTQNIKLIVQNKTSITELEEQIRQLKNENADLKKKNKNKKEMVIVERCIYIFIFYSGCWMLWRHIKDKRKATKNNE